MPPESGAAARPDKSVDDWLSSIKLGAFAFKIIEEGYEELQFLCDADESDIDELVAELQSSAGMKKPHAKTLKKAWRALAE